MRMIKILLIFLIALPLACNAQVKKTVETYDNGQIKSITYKNKKTGLLEGHCVSYMEDGRLLLEEDYKEGLRDGQVKYYDGYGNIASIVSYVKGEKQGKLYMYKKTSYPGETPRLDYIENYEKGKLQGMTYVYDQYGQKIIERARYVDGLCIEDTTTIPRGTLYEWVTKGPDGTYFTGIHKSKFVPVKKNVTVRQIIRRAPVVQRSTTAKNVKTKPVLRHNPTPITKPKPQSQPKIESKPRMKTNDDGTIRME